MANWDFSLVTHNTVSDLSGELNLELFKGTSVVPSLFPKVMLYLNGEEMPLSLVNGNKDYSEPLLEIGSEKDADERNDKYHVKLIKMRSRSVQSPLIDIK